MTYHEALTAAKDAARRELPDDLALEAATALLYLSALSTRAHARTQTPTDQAHITAHFTAHLIGDPAR